MVTVVMPVFNEDRFIARSLGSVVNQAYPADRLEVLVVDGLSSDGTPNIATEIAADHPNVRVIDNPARIVSTGLNLALRQSRGDVIVRIDGHSEVPQDYIARCVNGLSSNGASCVGGALDLVGQSTIARTIAIAQGSVLGAPKVASRRGLPQRRYVDSVPFAAYPRDVIERLGGWDERLIRHQDYEFNYRLRRAGGKILYDPSIRARYYCRDSLKGFWKQQFRYGFWKGFVTRGTPGVLALRHLAPVTLVAALAASGIASLLFSPAVPVFWSILIAWLLVLVLGSVHAATRNGWRLLPFLPFVVGAAHLGWGLGFWTGLLSLGKATKRVMDVLSSSMGLVAFGLALPFLAAAIWLDSGRPIFYSQLRVGRMGRLFRMYKLRTMMPDAEIDGPVWAEADDPRATRFGRWLRRSRMDELPQLFNVLKGDMSVVGPRPERPEFVSDLKEIPLYEIRHSVKPGLTGWAFVELGFTISFEEFRLKLQHDLYYVCNQSFWLDLVILGRTIRRSIAPKGGRPRSS